MSAEAVVQGHGAVRTVGLATSEAVTGDREDETGSQKVQRECEKLYFHTSLSVKLLSAHLRTHRQSIGRPAPAPNPMSFQVCTL